MRKLNYFCTAYLVMQFFTIIAANTFAQSKTLDADRIIARQNIYLKNYWINGIATDSSSFDAGDKLPTASAVKDYFTRRISAAGWTLTGNAHTIAGTNFIGTTDSNDLIIKTYGIERVKIKANGNVGINTTTPTEVLTVGGGILTTGQIMAGGAITSPLRVTGREHRSLGNPTIGYGFKSETSSAAGTWVGVYYTHYMANATQATGLTGRMRGFYSDMVESTSIGFQSLGGSNFFNCISGRTGVGVDSLTGINASAKFQIDSDSFGFLGPRMTTTRRLAIVSPAEGLQVYDTDINAPFFYNGSIWVNMNSGGGGTDDSAIHRVVTIAQSVDSQFIIYYRADGSKDTTYIVNTDFKLKGTASGNAVTTTISIAHGKTGVTSGSFVTVTAKSAAAANWSYVTTDAVYINIIYIIAPASGSANLLYDITLKP